MQHSFDITPQTPYSFELSLSRFARFQEEIVDLVTARCYRRLLSVDGQLALATVTSHGTRSRPVLSVELSGPKRTAFDRPEFGDQLRRILCTDLDLRPFYRFARTDDLLAQVVPRFRGLRIVCSPTVFEALVVAVLSQQVNLTFAYSIKRELVEAFGRRWRAAGHTYYVFPEPERFAQESEESLRRFRLSRAKAGTLVRLGLAFHTGGLEHGQLSGLSDDAVIERLTQLKGIGRWTVETALMRGLGRLDSFPGGDLGVVKYLAQGLLGRTELATEAEMRSFAERWRPYRSLALAYCYAELARRRAAGT